MTLIAVNAQEFESDGYYSAAEFAFLANKVLAAFGAAQQAGCRSLNSGPLGTGVFNGNLDLAVALHAAMAIAFEVPVTMWGMDSASASISTIVDWIEQGGSTPIGTVLRKLQRGVSWGHGRANKDDVHIDRSPVRA